MISTSLESLVGGFLGFGKTQAQTSIIFDRSNYIIGQTASVRIICDNSRCAKAVKEFKIKIYRQLIAGSFNIWKLIKNGYVAVQKFPGCSAHTKSERNFLLKIPDTLSSYMGKLF